MLGKLAQNCTGLCKSVNPVARYIMVGLDVAKCRSPFGVVEGEGWELEMVQFEHFSSRFNSASSDKEQPPK